MPPPMPRRRTGTGRAGRAASRIASARRRLRTSRSRAGPPRPRAGEQLGRQQRVVVEHVLERDRHRQRRREEGGCRAAGARCSAQLAERLGHVAELLEERVVALAPASSTGHSRRASSRGSRSPPTSRSSVDAMVTESATPSVVGLGDDVLVPGVGRHVEPALHRRAAEGDEPVAEARPAPPGVPRGRRSATSRHWRSQPRPAASCA